MQRRAQYRPCGSRLSGERACRSASPRPRLPLCRRSSAHGVAPRFVRTQQSRAVDSGRRALLLRRSAAARPRRRRTAPSVTEQSSRPTSRDKPGHAAPLVLGRRIAQLAERRAPPHRPRTPAMRRQRHCAWLRSRFPGTARRHRWPRYAPIRVTTYSWPLRETSCSRHRRRGPVGRACGLQKVG